MTDINDILTRVPVNKQAALGFTSKVESEIENLKRQSGDVQKQLYEDRFNYKLTGQHVLSKERRKELGQIQHDLDFKIKALLKREKREKLTELPYVFMRVCEENMNKFEFDKYKKLAVERICQERNSNEVEND